jgi:hypothetical protein
VFEVAGDRLRGLQIPETVSLANFFEKTDASDRQVQSSIF